MYSQVFETMEPNYLLVQSYATVLNCTQHLNYAQQTAAPNVREFVHLTCVKLPHIKTPDLSKKKNISHSSHY